MNSIKNYSNKKPNLEIETYFSGETKGYGLVQKCSGAVRRQFEVQMQGTWKDNKGILDEHFIFDDGEKQHRQWQLEKIDANHFIGKAEDVVGVAKGEQFGNAIHMEYVLRVPYKGSTIDVTMDDWLYRINDKIVLNNATMKKFGFCVGRLTASFSKD